MSKQEKLISADKLLISLEKELGFCIKEKFNEKNSRFHLGRETVLTDIIRQIESGTFNPDPVPTIKPGDTRQLLHNTIDVMTDEQVQLVAESLGLEVVKDE